MRTKTLLLTAACAVAGSVAINAQSVYSVNAVGYVNVTCPAGFTIVANPLNAPTNDLATVFSNLPDTSMIYLWNGHGWNIASYYVDGGWDNDYSFAPGTGAWLYNPTASPITVTFVGEVAQGTKINPISTGFNLSGSIVPQSGALDTDLGYTATDLDMVYLWRNHNWVICSFYADNPTVSTHVGSWDTTPVPNVGEGFWIDSVETKSWTRTFNVNQ